MAITYPLSLPYSNDIVQIDWTPRTKVGLSASVYTGQPQVQRWKGQWWEASVTLRAFRDQKADNWIGWKLRLNGREGTFLMGDPRRRTTAGTAAGAMTVGAGALADTTTLPLAGHTGSLAVGDWLQVGVRLHQVTQVNSGVSVEVWPFLRASYANGTTVIYANAMGRFRLRSNDMSWSTDVARIVGLSFDAMEDL